MSKAARALMVACLGLAAASWGWAADAYPAKPIRVVVGFPPGGSTDILARTFGQVLGEELKQSVIVENRPGAGGNIAMDLVAKAPPDGYTIAFATSGPLATSVSLSSKLPYDPVKDLQPITLFGTTPNVFAATAASGIKSMKDLIARAKAEPGVLNYGTGGNGTSQHLSGEMFKSAAGVRITHVAYAGGTVAANAALGGQVPLVVAGSTDLIPHIRSGRLVALAVTTDTRSGLLPEVPTMAEATGFKGIESSPWFGIVAPAGLPRDVLQKLHAASVAAIRSKPVGERMASVGGTLTPNTPDEFAAFMKSEIARWAKVIKEAGITNE